MKDSKYSVILMRDDSRPKRFRLHPSWIVFALAMVLVLLITSATGIYLSLVFYDQKKEAQSAYEQTRILLQETSRELEKRENLQKIFDAYDRVDLHSFLAGKMPESCTGVDLPALFEHKDKNLVKITNVQAEFIEGGMQVRLDVNNLAEEDSISGRVHLYLIRRDGLIIDLDLDHADLDFAITRFKNIDITFNLPQILEPGEIFALRIKAIDDQNNLLYGETFPMYQILV